MINDNYKFQKGFTLLEMLISILIITLGIISIFTGVIKYTQYTQQVRNNLTASYLAQEGIEIVKNIRDSNWTQGNAWNAGLTNCLSSGSGCEADYTSSSLSQVSGSLRSLYIDSNGFYEYTGVTKTEFTRKIAVDPVGNDQLNIKVDVFWNGIANTVRENIYNWKP